LVVEVTYGFLAVAAVRWCFVLPRASDSGYANMGAI